jgi:DNA-binding ferritin-like protein
MNKCDLVIDMLFHTADQTHLWHLQTKSYALHVALGGYYDAARDAADDIAEKYMGLMGKRLSAKGKLPLTDFKDVAQVKAHLDSVALFLVDLNKEVMSNDKNATHIVNAIDAFRETVDKTKYLLTLS